MGFVVIVIGLAVLFTAYFLGRFVVARSSGVRGVRATLGIRDEPWQGVSLGRRIGTSVAGFVGYYVGVALLVATGLMMSGQSTVDETSMRVKVAPDGPAGQAGVLDGDRILAVADVRTPDWGALKAEVAKHAGEPVKLRIERDGAERTLTVTPGSDGIAKGKILVGPVAERRDIPVGTALGHGFVEPFRVIGAFGRSFVRLFSGAERPELSGPVGIVRETHQAASNAFGDGLRLVGLVGAYLFYIALLVSVLTVPRPKKTR